jgi:phenol hydroxylase P1 protein
VTVDIRTKSVKPLRNTFAHLQARFGDKPATRYQEIAYDVQSEANFHYKPLWDPEHDLYDRRRTAVVMKDWYALKDPRQFYYGSYTTTRAKQQEALDRQMEFVEKRDLLRVLPKEALRAIQFALVPLRHYEWGANTMLCHVAAYGFGTAITQAAMMGTTDRLGMAQHLSRIGLLLDGNTGESLTEAKQVWLEAPAWQGLRSEVEHLFVTRDWFEILLAQALVADGLIYPLFFQKFDAHFAGLHGATLSSVTDFLLRWYEETARWVDAVIKTAAAESAENKALLTRWYAEWKGAFSSALAPLAAAVLPEGGAAALAAVATALDARAAKLGIGA